MPSYYHHKHKVKDRYKVNYYTYSDQLKASYIHKKYLICVKLIKTYQSKVNEIQRTIIPTHKRLLCLFTPFHESKNNLYINYSCHKQFEIYFT